MSLEAACLDDESVELVLDCQEIFSLINEFYPKEHRIIKSRFMAAAEGVTRLLLENLLSIVPYQ